MDGHVRRAITHQKRDEQRQNLMGNKIGPPDGEDQDDDGQEEQKQAQHCDDVPLGLDLRLDLVVLIYGACKVIHKTSDRIVDPYLQGKRMSASSCVCIYIIRRGSKADYSVGAPASIQRRTRSSLVSSNGTGWWHRITRCRPFFGEFLE